MKTTRGFVPHNFQPRTTFLGGAGEYPQILLAREVADTMKYIVSVAPQEFSWYGVVQRDGMTFLISEIIIVEQTVSDVTFDIEDTPDSNDRGRMFFEMVKEHGAEKANAVKATMHSHVNMGVQPSGYYGPGNRGDLCQMWQYGQNGAEYYIMGICNKRGELRFEIFFYDLGLRVEDVPWDVYEPENEELRRKVEAEVRAKTLTPKIPVSTKAKKRKARVVYSSAPKKAKRGRRNVR